MNPADAPFDGFDHRCMAEALQLAERGLHTTHPNPRVGCVIASGDDIVGRGWHQEAGGAHAEIAALHEAGDRARGATVYVTLEPCNFRGRTPACTEALIEAGVRRVVFAAGDPNPRVDGAGAGRLQAAGIRVQSGLMAQQAEGLNAGFLMRMQSRRPWVRVKLALSLDGRTALGNGTSAWISCGESRRDVQDWRARSSAILTGIGTLLADDPALNVRDIETRRQPARVIADSRWRTPPDAKTLGLEGPVLIAGGDDVALPGPLGECGAEFLRLPRIAGRIDLAALMTALADREFNEVQVEAGATLCGALLEARLVDEILVYQSPSLLGAGGRDPFAFGPLQDMRQKVELQWLETGRTGRDLRLRLQPVYGGP
jgi:diaminohydroxyphosphoribosylaminopyrimidine deaminase/5-amino-6-(5-phosphoribosylamino)uracil reductase